MSVVQGMLIHGERNTPIEGAVVSIGRAPDNDLVFEDESVSSHHARIEPINGVFQIQDLSSTNGTTINGATVSTSDLAHGDVIAFGSVSCVFQEIQTTPKASPKTNGADSGKSLKRIGRDTALQPTFWSRLARFGRSAIEVAKGTSHLAVLKARIEKLRVVDLRQAHFDLGRKCYADKILPEQYENAYREIRDLEVRIAEKRKGAQAAVDAKTGGKLRAFVEDQASKAAGEALGLKRNQLFVKLGRDVAGAGNGEASSSELLRVRDIEVRIGSLEDACAAERRAQLEIPDSKLAKLVLCGVAFLFLITVVYLLRRDDSTSPRTNDLSGEGMPTTKGVSTFSISDAEIDSTMQVQLRTSLGNDLSKSWQSWDKKKGALVAENTLPADFDWQSISNKLLLGIDRFQSLYLERDILVVGVIEDQVYEAKLAPSWVDPKVGPKYGRSFLLETTQTRFKSTGVRFDMPFIFVTTQKVTLKNGFEEEVELCREIVQEKAAPLMQELRTLSRQCATAVLHGVGKKHQWEDLYRSIEMRTRDGLSPAAVTNLDGKYRYQHLWRADVWGGGSWDDLSNVIVHETGR